MLRNLSKLVFALYFFEVMLGQTTTAANLNTTSTTTPAPLEPLPPAISSEDDAVEVLCDPSDPADTCLVYSASGVASGDSGSVSALDWVVDHAYSLFTMLAAITNNLPEAAYTVQRREAAYEVRLYPESQWVCSYTETSGFFWPGKDTAAMRSLLRYFSGKNSEGIRIPISVPLLVRRDTSVQSPLGNRYYVCLPLTSAVGSPFGSERPPPAPLSRAVSLQTLPRSIILASRFPGQADSQEWNEEIIELIENARNRAETGVDFENQYLATYNLPHKLWGRRNEVWLRQEVPETTNRTRQQEQKQRAHVRYLTDHNHI